MHDLIIRNAQVHDGLGSPPQRADVAVSQGHITHIGQVDGPARDSIDAQGLALMPGIVDLHTHYDAQVTWDRTLSPSPALGVTTAVIGNCGFGFAPVRPAERERAMMSMTRVEAIPMAYLSRVAAMRLNAAHAHRDAELAIVDGQRRWRVGWRRGWLSCRWHERAEH